MRRRNINTSSLEILVSTLGRARGLAEKMNITGDAIIVNQSAKYNVTSKQTKNGVVKTLSMPERGIGISRNTALLHADADIVLFADDDIVYSPDYEQQILQEFREHPEADGLLFNFNELNPDRPAAITTRYKRVHLYNCLRYGGYRLAVRRERVLAKNIFFSLLFGGGAKYSSGEDSLFIADCIKRGLKLYASPRTIGSVTHAESTWFKGYTDKFFFDRGVFFTFFSPRMSRFMILQFALRRRRMYAQQKTVRQAVRLMQKGARSVS